MLKGAMQRLTELASTDRAASLHAHGTLRRPFDPSANEDALKGRAKKLVQDLREKVSQQAAQIAVSTLDSSSPSYNPQARDFWEHVLELGREKDAFSKTVANRLAYSANAYLESGFNQRVFDQVFNRAKANPVSQKIECIELVDKFFAHAHHFFKVHGAEYQVDEILAQAVRVRDAPNAGLPSALAFMETACRIIELDKNAGFTAWVDRGLAASNPEAWFECQNSEAVEALNVTLSSRVVFLEDVRERLATVACGDCARRVRIAPTDELPKGQQSPRTNGNVIWHFPQMNMFGTWKENYANYLVTNTHETGHIRWGSFEIDFARLDEELLRDLGVDKGKYVVREDLDWGISEARRTLPDGKIALRSAHCFTALLEHQAVADWILNIVDDGRVDFHNYEKYAGIREDYDRVRAVDLARRPDFKPGLDGILEALLQLTVCRKTRQPMAAELEKAVTPLYEIAKRLQRAGADSTEAANATLEIYRIIKPLIPIPPKVDLPEDFSFHGEGGAAWRMVKVPKRKKPSKGEGEGKDEGGKKEDEGDDGKRGKKKDGDEGKKGKKDDEDGEGKGGKKKGKRKGEEGDEGKKGKKGRKGEEDERGGKGNGKGEEGDSSGIDGEPPEWEDGGLSYDPEAESAAEAARLKRGQHHYDEWDYRKNGENGGYHPDHATVNLCEPPSSRPPNPAMKPSIDMVGEQVRALQPKGRVLVRRQLEGDEVDSERWVQHSTRRDLGENPEADFYTRLKRNARSVSVLMLKDKSGSTDCGLPNGKKVYEVMDDAGEVVATAFSDVGDCVSVCSFYSAGSSSGTSFFVEKDFEGELKHVSVHPAHANRDGAAIRHATKMLDVRSEKTKVFILVSDGMPSDDFDPVYTGRYAVEDTAKAIEEARAKGITVFCIHVGAPAGHLEKIYGKNYIAVEDAGDLALRTAEIYMGLTGLLGSV